MPCDDGCGYIFGVSFREDLSNAQEPSCQDLARILVLAGHQGPKEPKKPHCEKRTLIPRKQI